MKRINLEIILCKITIILGFILFFLTYFLYDRVNYILGLLVIIANIILMYWLKRKEVEENNGM